MARGIPYQSSNADWIAFVEIVTILALMIIDAIVIGDPIPILLLSVERPSQGLLPTLKNCPPGLISSPGQCQLELAGGR